mgnify:CR=1 FL=1
MILIITHSKDNDGHFSGAICQYFEEKINGIKSEDIIYLRWSYGDKDPERSELEKYSKIYILDLTLWKDKVLSPVDYYDFNDGVESKVISPWV